MPDHICTPCIEDDHKNCTHGWCICQHEEREVKR
jgi:hypothetical protein